ncbi:MAG: hypothetical protein AVDCRST_MAG19-4585 [uncultured Thermomicrobiales bacterium]|uniref:SH3b domain-containing protein n=1 Tax=uncultured Thermomicrobiales bacterium TaxID=1645740 RepID=A0A6J4VU45_9BACT|nr:MAG: hypothetical protein AVDCRST_MAG19-4585 [uncultured Thermomicrobiales bacterium]
MMRVPVLRVCAVLSVLGMVWSVAATPRSASAASATAATAFELRATPGADAGVVASVPAGSPLSLDGPPQGGFYPVTFGGTFGWAPAAALIVTKDDPAPPLPVFDPSVPATEADAPTAEPVAPAMVPALPTEAPEPTAPVPTEVPVAEAAGPVVSTVAVPPTTVPAAATATTVPPAAPTPVAGGPETATVEAPSSTPAPVAETAVAPSSATAAPVETAQATTVVEPVGTPGSLPATGSSPTAESTPITISAATAEASPTAAPSPTPEATATPRPVVRGPATATVNLPLVAQPVGGSETRFTVPAGSTVTRMGSYVNGFVSVDFMGIVGWVDFALLAEPLASEPEAVAEPTAMAALEPTSTPRARRESTAPSGVGGPGSGEAYASNRLSLRSGPSASYPELGTIPAGDPVALTGVMEGGFVRVEYGGEIGWVSMSALGMPPDPTPETSRRGAASPRVYSREEIVRVIYAAADRYDQPRADMLRVAECESSLDPYAVNASGSYGLFQFVASTWETTPYADEDIFDPEANANAAGWMWSVGRRNEWVCQ